MPPKSKKDSTQKNKSTKNDPPRRPTRSCGAPARFGDPSVVVGNASVSQNTSNTATATTTSNNQQSSGDESDNFSTSPISLQNAILKSLDDLKALQNNQHMELEKCRRASEKAQAEAAKVTNRLNKLDRERQAQATAAVSQAKSSNKTPKHQTPMDEVLDSSDDESSDSQLGIESPKKPKRGDTQVEKKASSKNKSKSNKSKGNKKKRRNAKRKHDNSSDEEGECTGSSEESEDDESDDEPGDKFEHSMFGHRVGDTVPRKLEKKIQSGKFVEFSEVLPQFRRYEEEEVVMKMKGDRTTFVKKQNFRDLPWSQWSRACDIFTTVLTMSKPPREGMELMQGLMTYKKNMELLMRNGHPFAAYDRHFRKQQEHKPSPWHLIRQDLLLDYPSTSNSSRPQQQSYGNHSNQGSFRRDRKRRFRVPSSLTTTEGIKVKPGLCVDFNSKSRKCTRTPCIYAHKCTSCDGPHPIYFCRNNKGPSTSVAHGTGSHNGQQGADRRLQLHSSAKPF